MSQQVSLREYLTKEIERISQQGASAQESAAECRGAVKFATALLAQLGPEAVQAESKTESVQAS